MQVFCFCRRWSLGLLPLIIPPFLALATISFQPSKTISHPRVYEVCCPFSHPKPTFSDHFNSSLIAFLCEADRTSSSM